MFPEATVDYWCENRDLIDYDNVLVEFVAKHRSCFNFLIKEHPNVLGYRNPNLYGRLKKFENVVMCPTHVNSNLLSEFYDAVLVWTGSVGFESVIRGKPVITFCRPYYVSGNKFLMIDRSTESRVIVEFIKKESGNITHPEKLNLVRHLLSGIFPGKLMVDGSWDESNPEHVILAKDMGLQLRKLVFQNCE